MKKTILLLAAISIMSCKNQKTSSSNQPNTNSKTQENMDRMSISNYNAKDISGKSFDFATLMGKKIMIVNTASKCGLTRQYKDLEALYQKYKSDNFVVIGFPANDFMSQEPGTNEEIGAFCEKNYGVTFPMMSKITVKGDDMHPIYKFLTQKSINGLQNSEVEWNFQKYLINEKGQLDKVIKPQTLPNDPEIISWITN